MLGLELKELKVTKLQDQLTTPSASLNSSEDFSSTTVENHFARTPTSSATTSIKTSSSCSLSSTSAGIQECPESLSTRQPSTFSSTTFSTPPSQLSSSLYGIKNGQPTTLWSIPISMWLEGEDVYLQSRNLRDGSSSLRQRLLLFL